MLELCSKPEDWAADLRVGLRKWLFAWAGLKNICLISRDYVAATVDGNKSRESITHHTVLQTAYFCLLSVGRARKSRNAVMRERFIGTTA